MSRLFLIALSALLLMFSTGSWVGTQVSAQEKNSTKKIRIKPSQLASKCGSTVEWRESVEKAIEESATSGKPVFWYVPTIDGSFMDRKPEIDRYMMAGPFSWPAIADLLNEHFIPVKAVANRELQLEFKNIHSYKFVEPGFVVLNSDGDVTATIDQITTLDPYWIASMVAGWAGVEAPSLWSKSLQLHVNRFRGGTKKAGEAAQKKAREAPSTDRAFAERILFMGMTDFQAGNHEKARKTWQTAKSFPEEPLAWKALAEAEGWGPFVRGFENHQLLPDAAYKAGIDSRGSASPNGLYSEAELWKRSTAFILSMQSVDGGWNDSDYDFGGTDSLPNVHVAVSSLCGAALIESLKHLPDQNESILECIEKAAKYCSDRKSMNYVDRDEILWANAYRVRFLAKLVLHNDAFKKKYSDALAAAVTDLETIQTERGTWYHEYANSFVTATALTALKCAENAGAKVNMDKIKLGAISLANDRFNNGAYPYYGARTARDRDDEKSSGNGKIPASAGRMPLCELGLWQWGGSDDERLQFALTSSFANHKHLAVAYKYDNHTDTMAYGGFFFWYDMRSRAEALSFMTDEKLRTELSGAHRQLVVNLPELDGCFVDSHELGRCYGTAMALLTLSILDEIDR